MTKQKTYALIGDTNAKAQQFLLKARIGNKLYYKTLVIHRFICSCAGVERVVSWEKYLGVVFDQKLTWEKHSIRYLNRKLKEIIVAFRPFGHIFNQREVEIICCAYVHSI